MQGSDFEDLYRELVSLLGENDLRLLTAKLQAADSDWKAADPLLVSAAADSVIQAADADAVAAYFGLRVWRLLPTSFEYSAASHGEL
jgi:hypothetical protein